MSNHRIHFISPGNGFPQLFIFFLYNPPGSHQRQLVFYSDHQFFFPERFGYKIAHSQFEAIDNALGVI